MRSGANVGEVCNLALKFGQFRSSPTQAGRHVGPSRGHSPGRLKTAAPWGAADDRTLGEIAQNPGRSKTACQIAIGARDLCQGAAVSNRPGVCPWAESARLRTGAPPLTGKGAPGKGGILPPSPGRPANAGVCQFSRAPNPPPRKRSGFGRHYAAPQRTARRLGSPLQGSHRWSMGAKRRPKAALQASPDANSKCQRTNPWMNQGVSRRTVVCGWMCVGQLSPTSVPSVSQCETEETGRGSQRTPQRGWFGPGGVS